MPRTCRILILALFAGFLPTACTSVKLDDVAKASPRFDFVTYFSGHTRASGWFADRFDKPLRHFCGDFLGTMDGEELVLDEALYYTDGVVDTRVWRVIVDDDGGFLATSDALQGDFVGRIKGNALRMQYTMTIALENSSDGVFDFNDFMLLQPDGSLHNHTQVKKWGLRLGTATTQYARHDGSQTCDTQSPPEG